MSDAESPDGPPAAPYGIQAGFHGMIGRSAAMRGVFRKIEQYGPAEAAALITGETGTGKELVARALHRVSARRHRPFVALNCSALNEDLFESELFGHERGAFTGAVTTHKGRFERANTGTLFLDELGDMPQRVQAKLLRVLEHGVFERVGGEREVAADVRIVAATNVGLERSVAAGRFREDLYHRVAVLRVHVPALRERIDDLPLLVDHFLRSFGERYGRRVVRLTPEALNALEGYRWPGNVRELRNVLERLYVEATSDVIGRGALGEWERERELLAAGAWNVDLHDHERFSGGRVLVPGSPSEEEVRRAAFVIAQALQASSVPTDHRLAAPAGGGPADELPLVSVDAEVRGAADLAAEEITVDVLREAYRAARGNVTEAARRLGVHKATFYRHMERLGVTRDDLGAAG